jgi:hypothetical protein
MKLEVLSCQLINLSRLARLESVTTVWTLMFHRRHRKESGLAPQRRASSIRRTKLAILLMGALVVSVGSWEEAAARSKNRRQGHSVTSNRRKTTGAAPRHTKRVRARRGRVQRVTTRPATPGVGYRKQRIGSTWAHVVQVDLNRRDVRVTVGVADGGIGRCEPWSRIINRLRPTAAITGTYYDTRTFIPVGTIIANGIGVHQGRVGTALTFTADNRARFTRSHLNVAQSGLETVLRAGPRLIDQGRVSLMPGIEGFRDPAITARKPRAVVGLTRKNKLLLVTVTKPLLLRDMARVMSALGAVDAMCMDGGSSAGLYYAGKSYQVPRRVMTNVLIVYAGPRALARVKKA